jgi:uncharacterized metal-binding protein YceD (DUF177 family)
MVMTPEFARLIRIDTLAEASRTVSIEADEAERAALASRFGLIALDRLAATAELRRAGANVIADGRVEARAVQACVASGEPVPADLTEPFTLRFVPAEGEAPSGEEEIELSEDQLDDLTYANGSIDLGEAVAQTLALALDPFPRSPDAADTLREAGVVDEEDLSPFAALKALKNKL